MIGVSDGDGGCWRRSVLDLPVLCGVCAYWVHRRRVCGAGAGLCSTVGYGTGVGGVRVDEEAVVDMVGTSSSCFRVVVVQ